MQKGEILLNGEQQKAVKHDKGPLLIIAGAGTGKTTVITERINYLIATKHAKPEEILALTFTEKAAKEMETRVDIALPYGTFGLWISTFHSFADRILRQDALQIGLPSNFKLMTDAETYLFVKTHLWKFKLSYYRPHGNPYKFIEGLIQHFSRLKDEDVSVEDYMNFAKKQNSDRTSEVSSYAKASEDKEEKDGLARRSLDEGGKTSEVKSEEIEKTLELAKAYKLYEELKIKEGVMDFSDLISSTINLFRTRKSILTKYKKQFKYILVDEFQDTNYAQYEVIKLLAPPESNPNLAVVGDDSQSIYKFRGAAISNILSFMNDYKKATQIILTTSYRCPQTVLDAAYRLIKYNDPNTLESQLGISKNLTADAKYVGQKIEVIHTDRVETEAERIVAFIKEYQKAHDKDFKDFAILIRANNHGEPFIRALERAKIPYQFLGPGMLYHKSEIKDLIAYLKLLYDFTDSVSLYRVLSMDIWQIDTRDIIAAINVAKRSNISLFEQLEQLHVKELNITTASKEKFLNFVEMVYRHQKLIPKDTAGQILYYFLIDSGLLKEITHFKTVSEERKAQNIMKFFDRLKGFESTHDEANIFTVVDYLDLAMTMGESPLAAEIDWTENNAVNILTVHSAKGLEFPVVFLVNLVEGRFPTRERREQIPIPEKLIKEKLPIGDYHLQEERRLFYVGMTRAEEKLILSGANFYGEGKRERKLSPYIGECLGFTKSTRIPIYSQNTQASLFEWQKIEEPKDTSVPKQYIAYLSYSAIEAFNICPLHFKLRYILRIPTPPSAALSLGNSMHNALKDYYQHKIDDTLDSKQQTLLLLLTFLDRHWIPFGYSSKKHEVQAKARAKMYLEEYIKSPTHTHAHPIFLERPFSLRIHPDLKILGKIDRVDDLGGGKIEIIDYKTGAKIPTQKELDTNLQMTIYALAATNPGIFGKKIDQVRMSFYFFDGSQKITTSRSKLQLDEAAAKILELKKNIENSSFECSKTAICKNCEFKMLCN